MIKSTFINVVSDPSKIVGLSSEELHEVIKQFPYFSAAHLLLAKKLKQSESLQFEKQLNITAAYVPSRKILYDLIHDISFNELEVEESHVETPLVNPLIHQVKEEPIDELDKLIQSESAGYSLDYLDLPKEIPSEEKIETSLDERHQFNDWLNLFEKDSFSLKPSQNELIDHFISEESSIRIKPINEEVPENLAKMSAKDLEGNMVTETLAKIHLDQGNRMKAIEIYERLMLKYPEKRTYFAAQIEFLKQK